MNQQQIETYESTIAAPMLEADPFAKKTADEMTVRYGVYIGGPKILDLSPYIGEAYVQHPYIRRRQLTAFTEHPVGSRDESGEAQIERMEFRVDNNMPRPKVRMKSPKEDAYQIKKTYGQEGFEVCESLSGLAAPIFSATGQKGYDHSKAVEVYSVVVPSEFVSGKGTLKGLRTYLASSKCESAIAESKLNPDQMRRAAQLRNELLRIANDSFTHWSLHVNNLKGEWDAYRAGKPGKPEFNDVEEELFREVEKPLPAEQAAQANKAVVETVMNATKPAANTDALINMLLEDREAQKSEVAELRKQVESLVVADSQPKKTARAVKE